MFVFEYLKGNYFCYRENVTLILYFDFRENITGIVQTPIPMKKVCQRRGLEGKGLINFHNLVFFLLLLSNRGENS